METLGFVVTGIVLYVVADRLLDVLERRARRRFPQRSLVFFAILLVLALAGFALLRRLLA